MGRVLLGGIVGGFIIFAWGALTHMALPLGAMGFHLMSNEDAVIGALRDNIKEGGVYLFPGMDMHKAPTDSERSAWEAKLKQGPSGFLVMHPEPREAMTPRQLGTELGTDIVGALLAACALTQVRSGYGRRLLVVVLMGLFGFVTTSIPYWNWYGFPIEFTASKAMDLIGGWLLAGLVLAAIVRPRPVKENLPA
jgi:hypothetical protein